MRIDPALAQLRARAAPMAQPHTDAALAAWRARPEIVALVAALTRYGAGAQLRACLPLVQTLTDQAVAQALTSVLIGPLLAAIRTEPLAQPAIGHSSNAGLARLQLAASGRAALAVAVHASRTRTAPDQVLFEDGERHELVLSGRGLALCHRRRAGRLTSREQPLGPGARLACCGIGAARQIVAVSQPLVLLRLTRIPVDPAPGELVARGDGRVLRRISGCRRTAESLMALGVLGALGHPRALPEMARLVRDGASGPELRWEALRQCLACDARRGLALLAVLAGDPEDPLCRPAAALSARLAATRPDLAALMPEPA